MSLHITCSRNTIWRTPWTLNRLGLACVVSYAQTSRHSSHTLTIRPRVGSPCLWGHADPRYFQKQATSVTGVTGWPIAERTLCHEGRTQHPVQRTSNPPTYTVFLQSVYADNFHHPPNLVALRNLWVIQTIPNSREDIADLIYTSGPTPRKFLIAASDHFGGVYQHLQQLCPKIRCVYKLRHNGATSFKG